MPLVFVHGVNVRTSDYAYEQTASAQRRLMQALLQRVERDLGWRAKMEIVEPYWGSHGVTFAWNMATLPRVHAFESFGVEDGEGDDIAGTTIRALAANGTSDGRSVERFGSASDELAEAAARDLRQFLEAVITPVTIGESRLSDADADTEGALDALLARAVNEVASDREIEMYVRRGSYDAVAFLKERVQERFRELIPMGPIVDDDDDDSAPEGDEDDGGEPDEADRGTVEHYGRDLVGEALARIGELFDRANDAPLRAASAAALAMRRERLHRDLARFQGDVLVYVNARGDAANPGPIVRTVLDAIESAQQNAPNGEPLIVVTHSMGGNILYDVLTYYAPQTRVDMWFSVAGQVGLFEEMKLFKVSDPAIAAPNRVTSPLEPGRWVNIYDPLDVLSFVAEPVFDGVVDEEYHTGASAVKSHSEYFGRASFYDVMRKHLVTALRGRHW